MNERQYPLGTDRGELARLRFQHQLWSDAAHSLWLRANIGPGSRVLDVGCGPGAASLDLAELVGESGAVLGIDQSTEFVAHLQREAAHRALPQLEARAGDVMSLSECAGDALGSFDAAYARWVLCFTRDPAAVVRGVAALLRPGGRFCVHDYFNYEAISPAPRRASYQKFARATAQSWVDAGGDPDVVARLPALLHEHGFELEHISVHQRVARPGDAMWHWATSWWRSYGPKLLERGYVAEDDLAEFEQDEASMKRTHDFLALPPVYEIMARRLS